MILFGIVFAIIGIMVGVSLFIVLFISESPIIKKKTNILCQPSGEVIEVNSKIASSLVEHGYIKWDKKYKMYVIKDEMKKQHLKYVIF
jgi:hypothetical protein